MKIIDLHCDTLDKLKDENYSFKENNGHISEKRLIDGEYIAQCFAVYTPPDMKGKKATEHFKRQYEIFNKEILGCENIGISTILTVENGELLNGGADNIKLLKDTGVKFFGLTHNGENCLGFPCSAVKEAHLLPLKAFGREIVELLNSTNIYVDVSHLNYGGFMDVAKISQKPFVATHSASYSLCKHERNLTDEQIKIIGNSGGIIGVVFYSYFLNGTEKTEICDILRHIEHFVNVGGEDIAALGSDFDGMSCELEIKNASEMQKLSDAISEKFGFSIAEKICYKNAMRLI